MSGSSSTLASKPNTTTPTGGAQPPKQTKKQASESARTSTSIGTCGSSKTPVKTAPNPTKTALTPAQLALLKTGQRVSISVGTKGESYIGIEGAYFNLLTAYWGYAKRQLTSGVKTLFVEDGVKSTIQWIYAYMLAGENDFNAALKLEDMNVEQLADLYDHAAYLEYAAFKVRLQGILKFRLNNTFPTVEEIQELAYHVPVLSEYMMKLVAKRFTQPLAWDYTPYMEFAAEDKEFEAALNESVSSSLKYLIDRGIKYYAGPHHVRYLEWVQRYGLGQSSNAGTNSATIHGHATVPEPAAQSISSASASTSGKTSSTSADEQKPHSPFGKRSSTTATSTSNASASPVVCYNCQTPGHFARDCKNAKVERIVGPCYNCQTLGHLANDCKNARVGRTIGPCYNCNKPGHFARHCPEPRQDMNSIDYLDTVRGSGHQAHAERVGESNHAIWLVTDGEGVQTCTRVVRSGEVTRTGLKI